MHKNDNTKPYNVNFLLMHASVDFSVNKNPYNNCCHMSFSFSESRCRPDGLRPPPSPRAHWGNLHVQRSHHRWLKGARLSQEEMEWGKDYASRQRRKGRDEERGGKGGRHKKSGYSAMVAIGGRVTVRNCICDERLVYDNCRRQLRCN